MVEVTVKKVGINMVEVTRVKDTLFKVTMVEFTVVEVAMVKVTMVVVTMVKVIMAKFNKVDINMVEVTMVTGWLWLWLISSIAYIIYGFYRPWRISPMARSSGKSSHAGSSGKSGHLFTPLLDPLDRRQGGGHLGSNKVSLHPEASQKSRKAGPN